MYREGYGDKWAYRLPEELLRNLNDPWMLLEDFMQYCNIVDPPNITRNLFV